MQRITLDPDALAVDTFQPAPDTGAAAFDAAAATLPLHVCFQTRFATCDVACDP